MLSNFATSEPLILPPIIALYSLSWSFYKNQQHHGNCFWLVFSLSRANNSAILNVLNESATLTALFQAPHFTTPPINLKGT